MNVIVTGSQGLLGRAVVSLLRMLEHEVITVDRSSLGGVHGDPDSHIVADLRDRRSVVDIFRRVSTEGWRPDAVIHLAGRRLPVAMQETHGFDLLSDNLRIDLNVLAEMDRDGIGRGVYASTVSVYPENPWTEGGDDTLDHGYREYHANDFPADSVRYSAWGKLTTERLIEAWAEQAGKKPTRMSVVRLVNTYGPFDNFDPRTALVIPALIRRCQRKESPLVIDGDGTAVRDFLYVSDAAEGILAALEKGKPAPDHVYNLGSGRGWSVWEVVAAITAATGYEGEIQWATGKPTGAARKVVDPDKARRELGWEPKVDLKEGIRRTVEWLRSGR